MKGIMSIPPNVNLLVGSTEEESRDLPAEQGSVQWAQAPQGEQDARLGRAGSQDSPAGVRGLQLALRPCLSGPWESFSKATAFEALSKS